MKANMIVYINCFLTILLGCGRVQATSPGPEPAQVGGISALEDSTEAAIRRLLEVQEGAWNRGDLDGFMSGYWDSPELVFTSGAQVRRGYRPLLERYRETYGTDAEMGRLGFSGLEVHPLGPSTAWALGRWELELAERRLGGVFTLVLRKIEGEWKIVHDHTSSDPAPPDTSTLGGEEPR